MRQGVFNSAAGTPTRIGFGEIYGIRGPVEERGAKVGLSRIIDVTVGKTASSVNQQPADRSNTEPSAGRAEPLNSLIGLEESVWVGWWSAKAGERLIAVIALNICALKVGFDTEHEPFVPLPVETDLTAANDTGRIGIQSSRIQENKRRRIGHGFDIHISITATVTDVATLVEARPGYVAIQHGLQR